MDGLQPFISDQNITRFVAQLRRESNAVRQDTLKRLLIEEEDRFGASVERLHMVERYIADGAAQIARQTRIVSELKSNGGDVAHAELTLQNSRMIQDLFMSFRASISEAVRAELQRQ